MNVAPAPMFPEKHSPMFERSLAPSIPMNKGPLRFQEGVATDTDVPRDFQRGAYFDTSPSPMRMNQPNPENVYKRAYETMQERAHVGSASWVEAPEVLGEFVQGSMAGDNMPQFEYSYNSGYHMNRPNHTVVYD
jgi:hypothetical protein